MRTVSDKFLLKLRESHAIVAQADLLFPGELYPVEVPVEGGSVTQDLTAQVRRSGSVQIPWSLEAGADLGLDVRDLPYGGTAVLWRGLRFGDGSTELVQLGLFRVESVSWGTQDRVASLELADRMAQVIDEPFLSPYAATGGVGISRSGTLTDDSPIVTGLSATADLLVGQSIVGTGIPVAGRTILSKDSSSQITMSGPAQLSVVKSASFTPGDVLVEDITPDTSDLSVGMTFGSLGTIARIDSPTQIALAAPAPTPAGITRNGTLHEDSAVVTGLSTTADLFVGAVVTGTGIPVGTTIKSIDSSSQITLSHQANNLTRTIQSYCHSAPAVDYVQAVDDLTGQVPIGATVDCGVNTSGQQISQAGTAATGLTWFGSPNFYTHITLNKILNNVPFTGTGPGGTVRVKFTFPTTTLLVSLTFSNRSGSFTVTAPASASLTFGSGKRIAAVAVEIAQQVFGDAIAYRTPHDPDVTPGDVFYTEGRADAIAELAQAAGGQAYFDADGNFVFDIPPGTTDPVWDVDAGLEGVLVSAQESLDRTGVYNGVLVQGQPAGTDIPVSALVTDDDPDSPTLWGGPFGKVARIESSGAVQSEAQAATAAQALLDSRAGLTRSVSIESAPNPALEAGDVLTVAFDDGRSETHLADVVTTDLGTASQQIACRSLEPATARIPLPTRPRRRVLFGDQAWRELRDSRARVRVG